EGVAFTGRATHHDAAHARGDHEVDLRLERTFDQVALFVEGHGEGRQNPRQRVAQRQRDLVRHRVPPGPGRPPPWRPSGPFVRRGPPPGPRVHEIPHCGTSFLV